MGSVKRKPAKKPSLQNTGTNHNEKIHMVGPLAEKDEFKQAEERTKKAYRNAKGKT
jgi:hypothetical protein